jgi:hypothetical protein
MNAATATATALTTKNWGFKTPIQFKVAQRLAGEFYHAWGQVFREVEVRTPTRGGAIKIETQRVKPSTPAEASKWVEEDNLRYSPTGQCYGVPTPQWESGSGTYGVVVNPDGGYTMVYNGVVWEDYSPEGERTDAGLVPGWWEWHLDPKGRGQTLQQSMRLACACGSWHGVQDPEFIRLFEADGNFWRSGFVAGSRWYEWFPGAGPDMA